MKKALIITALTAITANFALTGCDAVNKKTAVDNTRTLPRAYVAAPNSDLASADNPLMLVNGPAKNAAPATNASPEDLSNIETAAGPGAQANSQAVIIQGGKVERNENSGFLGMF